MATGAAAFQRLKEPDNQGLNQGLQYWGGIKAQENAAGKLADERAGIRRDQEIKAIEAKYEIKDFQGTITGLDNLDEAAAIFTSSVTDKYNTQGTLAAEAAKAGDSEGERNARMKMYKMEGAFNKLKTMQDIVQKQIEASKELNISGVESDNFIAVAKGLDAANVTFQLDENFNPVAVGMKTLEDGTQVPFEMTYAQVANGEIAPIEENNIAMGADSLAGKIAASLGTHKYDKNINRYKTESGWSFDGKVEEGARSQIKALVNNPSMMADLHHQLFGGSQKKDFTDKQKKDVEDRMVQAVESMYDTEKKMGIDAATVAANSQSLNEREFAERQKQNRIANARADAIAANGGNLTEEQKKYSVRNYNINLVSKGDLNSITGKIEIDDEDYKIVDKYLYNNQLVIKAEKDGKIVTKRVSIKDYGAINEVFDSMEGTNYNLDNVLPAKPFKYRDLSPTQKSGLEDIIGKVQREWYQSDDDVVEAIKELYPEYEVKDVWNFLGINNIKIRDKTLSLYSDDALKNVEDALGTGSNKKKVW